MEPSSFGCTPLQWSPRKSSASELNKTIVFTSPIRCVAPTTTADMSSGYESMLLHNSSLANATVLDSSRENSEPTGLTNIVSSSTINSSTDWSTPVRPEKPKRRWLREALTTSNEQNTCSNQTRPSVIMHACQPASPRVFEPSNTSTPAKPMSLIRALQNAEKQWTGAIALMQLASSTHS